MLSVRVSRPVRMQGYVLATERALGEPAYMSFDTLSVSCKEQSGWDADHKPCLAPQVLCAVKDSFL